MRGLLTAALLTVAAPVPALAAPPAPVARAAPGAALADRPSEAEAAAFARLYSPSALRREAELRNLHQTFIPTMRQDANMKVMLDAFPALGPAFVGVMEQNLDLYMRDYDARYLPRLAALFRTRLTRTELADLSAFYRSPLGIKIQNLAAGKVDASEITATGLTGANVDGAMMDRQLLQVGWAVFGGLDDTERRAFAAFIGTPPGRSLVAIMPEMKSIAAEIVNSPSPAFEAAIQSGMKAAMMRITGIDPDKAK